MRCLVRRALAERVAEARKGGLMEGSISEIAEEELRSTTGE
jgi:hypothetical protein